MNEKLKSIWRKWTGPRAFLFRATFVLILIWLAAFIAMLVASLLETERMNLFYFAFAMAGLLTVIMGLLFVAYPLFQWLFSWRIFKRFLFGLICFITLISLFYAEENWRGKHEWEKFKREWEAKGEHFDFASFVPASVPDAENFALTPLVFTSYGQLLTRDGKAIPAEKRDKKFVNRLQMPITDEGDSWPTNGNWEIGRLTDLKSWQDYYRQLADKTNSFQLSPASQSPAASVLEALSKYDPTIEELREASRLPYSRFPIEYDKDEPAAILLPHLAVMKSCIQVLGLRAVAELQAGQGEKAAADIKLMLYLNHAIRSEPILISHLVRLAMINLTLQPVYEGLAACRWTDAQLAGLDSELARLDFLADYKFSIRGEMLFGISETEYLRRSRNFQALDYNESGMQKGPAMHLGLRLAPAGFFYRNELTIARLHEHWMLGMADVENRTVSPQTVKKNSAAAQEELQHGWPFNILARLIFPAIGQVIKKYAYAQSSIDLARTAIALERFRLAHGEFPESLDALAPQFLAKARHDVIGGQPLNYRRTVDGTFVLYSVGWNEKDDGGVVVFKKGSNPRDEIKSDADVDQGDWVWRYPKAE